MAKNLGLEIRGKLGDKIYTSYLGRPYVRRMPDSIANPRTEAQQAHRNSFATVSRLSSDLKAAHQIGLYKHAQRENLTTFSDFRKLNKNKCVGTAVSYPYVMVSKGPVDVVNIKSVELDNQHVLRVTFDGEVTDKNKDDVLALYVYCPALRTCLPLQPVLRPTGIVSEELPDIFVGHDLHLYGFMQNKDLRTSETLYAKITD